MNIINNTKQDNILTYFGTLFRFAGGGADVGQEINCCCKSEVSVNAHQ